VSYGHEPSTASPHWVAGFLTQPRARALARPPERYARPRPAAAAHLAVRCGGPLRL